MQGAFRQEGLNELLEMHMAGILAKEFRVLRTLAQDSRWFEENREAIAKDYPNVFVAILGKKVIDSDVCPPALNARLEAKGVDSQSVIRFTGRIDFVQSLIVNLRARQNQP